MPPSDWETVRPAFRPCQGILRWPGSLHSATIAPAMLSRAQEARVREVLGSHPAGDHPDVLPGPSGGRRASIDFEVTQHRDLDTEVGASLAARRGQGPSKSPVRGIVRPRALTVCKTITGSIFVGGPFRSARRRPRRRSAGASGVLALPRPSAAPEPSRDRATDRRPRSRVRAP